jgi:hypothetical protein
VLGELEATSKAGNEELGKALSVDCCWVVDLDLGSAALAAGRSGLVASQGTLAFVVLVGDGVENNRCLSGQQQRFSRAAACDDGTFGLGALDLKWAAAFGLRGPVWLAGWLDFYWSELARQASKWHKLELSRAEEGM